HDERGVQSTTAQRSHGRIGDQLAFDALVEKLVHTIDKLLGSATGKPLDLRPVDEVTESEEAAVLTATASGDSYDPPGLYCADALEESEPLGWSAESIEEAGNRSEIGLELDPRSQRADFRGKQEGVGRLMDKQRLDAEPVARQEERARGRVIKAER